MNVIVPATATVVSALTFTVPEPLFVIPTFVRAAFKSAVISYSAFD